MATAKMPKFTKSPPELQKLFVSLVPAAPGVEQRKMFGYPAFFVNGNMAGGLFGDDVILKLSEKDRAAMQKAGATAFEPMPGRVMREYVTVPRSMQQDSGTLAKWMEKAREYAGALPPKKKK